MSDTESDCEFDPAENQEVFPIEDLPPDLRARVIRSLDMYEIMNLALSSDAMENNVQTADKKGNVSVYISSRIEDLDKIDKDEKVVLVSKWHDESKTLIENASDILQRLLSLFCVKMYGIFLIRVAELNIPDVMKSFAAKQADLVSIDALKITEENIDVIIQETASDQALLFFKTEFPEDYKNVEAFKYRVASYDDARWVTLPNLLSMKNMARITLGQNKFHLENMNTLIKYWINCDTDLFDFLKVDIDRNRVLGELFGSDMESADSEDSSEDKNKRFFVQMLLTIMEGVVYLRSGVPCDRYIICMARPCESRMRKLLTIELINQRLHFVSHEIAVPSDEFNYNKMDSFLKEYQILELLNQKRKLKNELKNVDRETREEGNLEKLDPGRQEIIDGLQEIKDQLKSHGVYNEDGLPTFDLPPIPLMGPHPKPFQLMAIPRVARNRMIKQMGIFECVGLALCSIRMENMVKDARVVVENHSIMIGYDCWVNQLSDENSVFLNSDKTGDVSHLFDKEDTCIDYHFLKAWHQPTQTKIENVFNVFTRLKNVFIAKNFGIITTLKLPLGNFEQIMALAAPHKFHEYNVCGKITTDQMDLLMEKAESDVTLCLEELSVPEDYSHPNAFNFQSVNYGDASWVRVEHLFSARGHMLLNRCALSLEDINTFIIHWITSGTDMFQSMRLCFEQRLNHSDYMTVLEDIVAVYDEVRDEFSCIAAETCETRKKMLLSINCYEKEMLLTAHEVPKTPGRYYFKRFQALELMNHRKALRIELEGILREEAEIGSDIRRHGFEKYRDVLKRKGETNEKQRVLEEKLVALGVRKFELKRDEEVEELSDEEQEQE
ncbi:hypothetical protein GCK72_003750 [Caenorhabditis remanei]|uniref:Uncharacterized protein n=1 Tax=Caenorhabditis remanei TaxID=31234 RepID=A0A6A5H9F2_CAERE|nr:hypothetical protein GCK72_003750 [Caenorhabditis remanei]KAF1763805.1 hypothetical protein GCK72_003750 [Caenorhabditis remanei]